MYSGAALAYYMGRRATAGQGPRGPSGVFRPTAAAPPRPLPAVRNKTIIRESLISYVATMIGRQFTKADIKRFIYEYNGELLGRGEPVKCSLRTVERVMKLARAELFARAREDSDSEEAKAFEHLKSVIRDDSAKVAERLKAQEMYNYMRGLGAQFGPRSSPGDRAQAIRELLAGMDDSVAGEPEAEPDGGSDGSGAQD